MNEMHETPDMENPAPKRRGPRKDKGVPREPYVLRGRYRGQHDIIEAINQLERDLKYFKELDGCMREEWETGDYEEVQNILNEMKTVSGRLHRIRDWFADLPETIKEQIREALNGPQSAEPQEPAPETPTATGRV